MDRHLGRVYDEDGPIDLDGLSAEADYWENCKQNRQLTHEEIVNLFLDERYRDIFDALSDIQAKGLMAKRIIEMIEEDERYSDPEKRSLINKWRNSTLTDTVEIAQKAGLNVGLALAVLNKFLEG